MLRLSHPLFDTRATLSKYQPMPNDEDYRRSGAGLIPVSFPNKGTDRDGLKNPSSSIEQHQLDTFCLDFFPANLET
jgi:hypothetical protein